jgi:lysozyme
MELSKEGLDRLKALEGLRLSPYFDSAGRLTVGYGHLIRPWDGVSKTESITEERAEEILRKDVSPAVACINDAISSSSINQNQFDALVWFVYNIGCSAFQSSTMLRLINTGQLEAASNEFLRWDKVHNAQGMFVEVVGLKNRRTAEKERFLTPQQEGTTDVA